MPRKVGSKNKTKNINKNVNTAKNKNVININVNSNQSTKRGRGRPKNNNTNTTKPGDNPPNSSSGYNARPQQMPPPIIPIIAPAQDASMTLLSQFLTSKMLNDSNRTINLPETTQLNYSRSSVEPSHTFNSRESIIPKIPDTPHTKQQDIVNEIKPYIQAKRPSKTSSMDLLPKYVKNSKDELRLNKFDIIASKYDKEDTDYYDYEPEEKQKPMSEINPKKIENEVKPQQQSTSDFLKMNFTPPKRDIVQMLTPQKEPTSTAITPYKEKQSTLDFLMGGTPQKPKPTKEDIKKARIIELQKKKQMSTKETFELNDLKSHFTSQPNSNKDIAGSMITKAIKSKIARKDFKDAKDTYDPAKHQDKIRDKRKEFTRIITTQSTTHQAKEEAQKRLNKTEHLFKRKSNAGRPPSNPYTGLKQTEI